MSDLVVRKVRSHIDEALYDDEAFNTLPAMFQREFRLVSTMFLQCTASGQTVPLITSFAKDHLVEPRYWQEFASDDLFAQTAVQYAQPNTPQDVHIHLSDRELLSSRFYNELLLPFTEIRYCMGIVYPGQDASWMMGWHRGRGSGGFTKMDQYRMAAITADMRRLAAVRTRLAAALAAKRSAESRLDRLPEAIVTLDARGCLRHANLCAETLLRRKEGLVRLSDGTIVPQDLQAREGFRMAVCAAALRLPRPHGRLRLPRGEPKVDLLADILPGPGLGGEALVIIADPDHVRDDRVESLRRFYSLTPAEAQVAVAIAAGKSLQNIAKQGGVSINTIKSQLKSIMNKMQVDAQGDIVRCVERMP